FPKGLVIPEAIAVDLEKNQFAFSLCAAALVTVQCNAKASAWDFIGPVGILVNDCQDMANVIDNPLFITAVSLDVPQVWFRSALLPSDTSSAVFELEAVVPAPNGSNWVRSRAISTSGNGAFSDVTYLQEVNVIGGSLPPASQFFITTSFSLPYTRRQQSELTINPFLFDIVPGTPKNNTAAALKEVCSNLSTALSKKLADCEGAKKGTDVCNKLNGSPINQDAVTKNGKQCEAHTIKNGAFNPNIFDNALLPITQNGNTFTVGKESFQTLSDAVIGACKEQRQRNLATLDECAKNAANAAKCNKLDGTQVTREEVNLHNS
ncbi:7796_t:CDS:2, partial [Acaulospora colombiana]